jgi:DNA polymerase-1
MPDVTADMSHASHWANLYDNAEDIILTPEEIKAFNEDSYVASGTMVMDLRTIKDTFDGKARNEAIKSSATADAEYYFGWTYGSDGKKAEWAYYEKMIRNCIDPKAKKNKRGNYSTDEETLTELADKHPIVNEILRFRAIKKLLSTYIEPFPSLIDPADGKVHTTFNQALTATGRLSSVKPNLQNIPIRTEMGKEIRRAFIGSSAQHRIVSADYSQIELRIMAALSGDNDMIEAFRNGKDIHTATAAKIFKEDTEDVTSDQRRIAKTANFGIIYGISPFGLSQRLNIPRKEAKELIEEYFLNYPAISEYIERMKVQARENGFVQTIFGRKRYLKDINSRNATVRGFAERNAINAPIQGSAADIIKMAMINVAKALKENNLESKMILQVHDELVFDCPVGEVEKVKAIVREQMENVTRLSVPLTVECNDGENWLQAH